MLLQENDVRISMNEDVHCEDIGGYPDLCSHRKGKA